MTVQYIPDSVSLIDKGEFIKRKTVTFHDFHTKAVIGLINEYLAMREDVKEEYKDVFLEDGSINPIILYEELTFDKGIFSRINLNDTSAKKFYKNFGKCALMFGTIGSFEDDQDLFDIIFNRLMSRLYDDLAKGVCHENFVNITSNSIMIEEYKKLIEKLEDLVKRKEISDEMYYFCACLIEQKHYTNTYDGSHHFY